MKNKIIILVLIFTYIMSVVVFADDLPIKVIGKGSMILTDGMSSDVIYNEKDKFVSQMKTVKLVCDNVFGSVNVYDFNGKQYGSVRLEINNERGFTGEKYIYGSDFMGDFRNGVMIHCDSGEIKVQYIDWFMYDEGYPSEVERYLYGNDDPKDPEYPPVDPEDPEDPPIPDRTINEILEDLEKVIKDINGSLDGVKTDLGSIKNSNQGINDSLNQVKNDLGTAKNDLGKMKGDLGQVKNDLGTIKNDLGTIKNNTGVIRDDVGQIKKDVGAIKDNLIPSIVVNDKPIDSIDDLVNIGRENIPSLPSHKDDNNYFDYSEENIDIDDLPIYLEPENWEGQEREQPIDRDSPLDKDTPPDRDTPLGKDTPPDRDTPLGKDTPPDRDTPLGKDTPPDRDTPLGKDIPPDRDTPLGKDTPPDRDTPLGKDTPFDRDIPFDRDLPSSKDSPPDRDSPLGRDNFYERDKVYERSYYNELPTWKKD